MIPSTAVANEKTRVDLRDTVEVDDINEQLQHQRRKTPSPKGAKAVYTFGFDMRSGPMEDARQYLPLLKYLNRTTGLSFKLRFTEKSQSIIEDLGTGRIDFAAIGAVSFLQAEAKYGIDSLARGINKVGMAAYQSLIVAAPDSPVQSIEDLKGRRMAFGAETSTQGHLIPRILMAQNGLTLDDFASYRYTGSHHACATAVIQGQADACGMQDTMARRLVSEGLLKIVHQSRFYPSSGIAAHQDVPADVREAVKEALLAFDPLGRDRAGLYNWQNTEMPNGFQDTTPKDYTELRTWLIKLGFLAIADGTADRKGGE